MQLDEPLGKGVLKSLGMNGQLVHLQNLDAGSMLHEVDLSHFTAGSYFLQLSTSGVIATKKIIKAN